MDSRYRENAQHGSSLFPFQMYETPNPAGPFTVPLHWHPQLEIILVERGRLEITVDGAPLAVPCGELLFVSPGSLHAIAGDGADCQYAALVFPLQAMLLEGFDVCQGEYLLPLARGEASFPLRLPPSSPASAGCRAALAGLFGAFRRRPRGYQLCVRGQLLQLFGLLAEYDLYTQPARTAGSDQARQEQLRAILQYLGDNSHQPLSLAGVAAEFGFSPKYFCRFFQRQFGRSFVEYLNEIRLQKAAGLLAGTDDKVTDIAAACGYENLSYFIRRFRRHFGASPSGYRAALRQQQPQAERMGENNGR